MAKYIDQSAAIARLTHLEVTKPVATMTEIKRALADMFPADVAPVVHGRWEYIPQTLNTLSQLRCPFCGWWSLDPSIDGAYNYCPNCGAKMDGGAENG